MPIREPVVHGATSGYTLRHVGPKGSIWPNPNVTVLGYVLLNQPNMVSREIPSADIPGSPDYQQGTWVGRVNDAGEGSVIFPNSVSSDGIPWRDRFDPAGRNEWIEVYNDGYLESVFCIVTPTNSQQNVTITGGDGFWVLKGAYVRDWVFTGAPHDVIERGTRLWVPLTVDAFEYQGSTVPGSQWSTSSVSTTGVIRCRTGSNDASIGGQAWVNPGNIASGSSAASFSVTGPQTDFTFVNSQGLRATNFGFAIPTTATIVGLEVTVTSETTESGISDMSASATGARLVFSGALTGYYPETLGGRWIDFEPSGPETLLSGSPTDMWHTFGALTPSVVNVSNFGVQFDGAIGVYGAGSTTFLVYRVSVTLYYTDTSGVVASIRSTGGLSLNVPAINTDEVSLTSQAVATTSPIWTADVSAFQLPTSSCIFSIQVFENPGSAALPGSPAAQISVVNGTATFYVYGRSGGTTALSMGQVTPAVSTSYDLRIESDGTWLWGFVNGQALGCGRRGCMNPTSMQIVVSLLSTGGAGNVVVSGVALEVLQPYLMRSVVQRQNPAMLASTGGTVLSGSAWPWDLPAEITSLDGRSVAAKNSVGTGTSNLLYAIDFGFGSISFGDGVFGIPFDATITGVEVAILRANDNAANTTVVDNFIGLVNETTSTTLSNNRAVATAWPSPKQWAVYGGVQDLWGADLTPAIVNDPGFGVALRCSFNTSALACNAIVYYPVQMTIYYTLPGGDAGDWVLPGGSSTYPWGGLHGRYFNDLDLQSDSSRSMKILSPLRTQAMSGSSAVAEYANRQDATVNFTSPFNPLPGAAPSWYSVRWFGAIYLKFSLGDYDFTFTADDGVRVWVGKTSWGDQIIDAWFDQASASYTATVTAASLAGNPGYGGDPVARDGWYPIVIEYYNSIGASNAQFSFTPPAAYTDPGGTALTAGTSRIVPTTSLSPLGCVDQRYQGISHFDMVQQTLNAVGYQASVEPQRLESGLFPGVLAPRIREGHDTDVIIEPDYSDRAEGILNYQNVLDASDSVCSLQGNGAGFQNGLAGQLQATVYDPTTLHNSLFDVQGWQDFGDAAYSSLLEALLNSQLGLRLAPWQTVTGDPLARERLAGTWPLSAALAEMRYRPGDGVRIRARDISVWDHAPRQLLAVTRNFAPKGVVGTQVTWANRPRSEAHTLKTLFYSAQRPQRNYQHQIVTVSGTFAQTISLVNGATSGYTIASLMPGDTVIRARLRMILFQVGSVRLVVNAVDQTSAVGGPWSVAGPYTIDVTSVALADGWGGRIYASVVNTSGVTLDEVDLQLLIDVMR